MYKRYSEDEIRTAGDGLIIPILYKNGEEVKGRGPQYTWVHDGHPISIRGNLWFDHYEQEGGNTISFVKNYFGCGFREAMDYILNNTFDNLVVIPDKKQEFQMPIKNNSCSRVETYLNLYRGISMNVIREFEMRDLIFEEYMYHNAVFVGYDNNKNPRHAFRRGIGKHSSFKRSSSGSEVKYSFHWNGQGNILYYFESPIDLLSFICLSNDDNWKKQNYMAACGVSMRPLNWFVANNKNVNKVVLCLDNDKAGQEATERIRTELEKNNIEVEVLMPTYKDWNEDLLLFREEEERCQQVL